MDIHAKSLTKIVSITITKKELRGFQHGYNKRPLHAIG
jgi:hypothetical protein